MLNNRIVKSDVLYEVGVKFDDYLEAAKADALRAEGAAKMILDYSKKFDAWTVEARASLIKEINDNKTTAETANAVLAWLSKGRDHVNRAADDIKALYGVKRGEVIAYENSVSTLKDLHLETKREEEKELEEQRKRAEDEALAVAERVKKEQEQKAAEEARLAAEEEKRKLSKVEEEVEIDLAELQASPEDVTKTVAKKRPDQDHAHPLFKSVQDLKIRRGLSGAPQISETIQKSTRGRKKKPRA